MNDRSTPADSRFEPSRFEGDGSDPLDRLLESARADVPPQLAERLIAGARSSDVARRFYWADVGYAARTALLLSAASLLVAAGLAGAALVEFPREAGPPVAFQQPPSGREASGREAKEAAVDPIVQLAVSPRAVERQVNGMVFGTSEEDRGE